MQADQIVSATAGPDDPLSETVVRALAVAHDAEPTTLTQPLYDVIDPDALDNLFPEWAGDHGRVEFTYQSYVVTVKSNGDITIHPQDTQPAADD